MTRPAACRMRAFTLIELLITISIIGILMAIMIPNLPKAKEMARKATCASNLKQWGALMGSIERDNDFLPWVPDRGLYPIFMPVKRLRAQHGTWGTLGEGFEDFSLELVERYSNAPIVSSVGENSWKTLGIANCPSADLDIFNVYNQYHNKVTFYDDETPVDRYAIRMSYTYLANGGKSKTNRAIMADRVGVEQTGDTLASRIRYWFNHGDPGLKLLDDEPGQTTPDLLIVNQNLTPVDGGGMPKCLNRIYGMNTLYGDHRVEWTKPDAPRLQALMQGYAHSGSYRYFGLGYGSAASSAAFYRMATFSSFNYLEEWSGDLRRVIRE